MSLRTVRLKLGLTQEDIFRKTNLSMSTIVRAEKGKCNLKTAREISLALGMSIEEIFFDEETNEKRDR